VVRLVLVRSQSAFGFSMIYVVFDDNVELYFARTRVLEHMSLITKGLDYVGFRRDIEAAYRTFWKRWCFAPER